jgi:hypothetical protein
MRTARVDLNLPQVKPRLLLVDVSLIKASLETEKLTEFARAKDPTESFLGEKDEVWQMPIR